ncbi:MAG: prenyltransferase [Theionarchaea archaeon]|nr:prenyltransferase [Theionarchaea archaeon]MBU7001631.1 prenyltransferase [Theionarchaea archaeon]MBU7021050.1 prenyltransferase [Theionarchaea archaeon]
MTQNAKNPGRTWKDVAKGLFMEIRIIPVLVWAFTAVLIGTAVAYLETGIFVLGNFALAMIVACLVQAYPTHAANEIVDWLSGTDAEGHGGSKVIREGLLTIGELRLIFLGSMGIVGALAAFVAITIDVRMVWFGIVGIAASVFYSIPPFKLGYHPFVGEWVGGFVGVFVAVTGSYFIQGFTLSFVVILTGIAVGMADVAIMEMFHTVDYEADRSADPQKRTTIVFLGPKRGQFYVLVQIVGSSLLFWILTFYHREFVALAITSTACIYFYQRYNPLDVWDIIRNTKRVTWATISSGVVFASLSRAWFTLLTIPVVIGYIAHKKWGKLPKKTE